MKESSENNKKGKKNNMQPYRQQAPPAFNNYSKVLASEVNILLAHSYAPCSKRNVKDTSKLVYKQKDG